MAITVEQITRSKCPRCKARRLLAGPFYDRLRIRCQECNYVFRLKDRKG